MRVLYGGCWLFAPELFEPEDLAMARAGLEVRRPDPVSSGEAAI